MSLVISILAIGLIITIHELGHFSLAKAFRVGVVEFSLGMGPKLLSKVYKNTEYSLRILPFGGSCMMLGEEDEETEDGEERRINEFTNLTLNGDETRIEDDRIIIDGRSYERNSQFYNKPAWQRFLIIFAGPLFNFLLVILLSVVLTAAVGWDRPELIEVMDGSPASEAGLRASDRILRLSAGDRKMKINTARDMALFFSVCSQEMADGKDIVFEFLRDGKRMSASVKPAPDPESGRMICGITYSLAFRELSGISELLPASFYNTDYTVRSTFESLRMLFTGKVSSGDVSGIVGIVAIMDENAETAATEGGMTDAVLTLINIMILISGSLGITNLLPLPALDGGRLCFILIELFTGKAVPKKIESYVHAAGMVLLLLLMAAIMIHDVIRLL